MKIFLTGGTGLVGRHTIDLLLSAGHSLECLVRNDAGADSMARCGAAPVRGVVEDPTLWQSVAADAIVHAAALLPGAPDPGDYEEVNVTATRLAGETAVRIGARLVHISSVAVYGPAGFGLGDGTITENTRWAQHRMEDLYGRSKRAAEEALRRAVRIRPESTVVLRPCVIYGAHDRLFVPKILAAMRFGLWPLSGRGNNSLAVVHAGNVAAAILAALEHPDASGAFNITNDGEISQRDFFRLLGGAAGKKLQMIPLPTAVARSVALAFRIGAGVTGVDRFGDLADVAVDWLRRDNPYSSERAKTDLGWRPPFEPVEAVRRTGQWFAANKGG